MDEKDHGVDLRFPIFTQHDALGYGFLFRRCWVFRFRCRLFVRLLDIAEESVHSRMCCMRERREGEGVLNCLLIWCSAGRLNFGALAPQSTLDVLLHKLVVAKERSTQSALCCHLKRPSDRMVYIIAFMASESSMSQKYST